MNKPYKILIAEDDVLISESLKMILEDLGYEVCDIVSSFLDARSALEKYCPDLAILDINMNGRAQGIEIAAHMAERYTTPFIFLTSYADEKTIDAATQYSPAAYLVKPFNSNTIYSTVKLALASSAKRAAETITIKEGHSQVIIPVNELRYIQADDVYIQLHTVTKKYLVRMGIKSFLNDYPLREFVQTHRSYVVNKKFVTALRSSHVVLDALEIPISRTYTTAVKQALQ